MFTIQNIKAGDKYCVCQDSWRKFKIVNINPQRDFYQIRVCTSDKMMRKVISSFKNCSHSLEFLNGLDFEFEPNDHVKFECDAVDITLVGVAYEGSKPSYFRNRFEFSCPFSEFEESLIGYKK